MDPTAEIEHLIQTFENAGMVDIAQVKHLDFLGEKPNPPLLPTVPAEPGYPVYHSHPQGLESLCEGYYGYTAPGAGPHSFEEPMMALPGQAAHNLYQQPLFDQNITQSGCHPHVYYYTGAYCQEEYLPHQPVYNVPETAAPLQPCMSMVTYPQGQELNLPLGGIMVDERVFGVPPDLSFTTSDPAVPPQNTSMSRKRMHAGSQHERGKPYVKKPPNAFMMFMREERPKIVAFNSAGVNAILGQRWKSMSEEEQAKYYEQAEKEKQLHAQNFPEWSSRDNYGKKRKRIRRKATFWTEA